METILGGLLTGTDGIYQKFDYQLLIVYWHLILGYVDIFFFSGMLISSFIDSSRSLVVGLIKDFLETILGGMLTGTEGILSETWLSVIDSMLPS